LDLKGRRTDRGENFIMMNFTASPNIVSVIKLRGRGEERCLQSFGWEARREETTGKT
jgi:hypothetical protein